MSNETEKQIVNAAEVKRRRLEQKLSMGELAKRCGFVTPAGRVARQRIYEIEAGLRSSLRFDTVSRLASALNCKPEEIMTTPSATAVATSPAPVD